MKSLIRGAQRSGTARFGDARSMVDGFAGALGAAAALSAATLAAVLAVVFAATLAVVMLLASLLMALAVVAWRVRPKTVRSGRSRRGHAWITYSWDAQSR